MAFFDEYKAAIAAGAGSLVALSYAKPPNWVDWVARLCSAVVVGYFTTPTIAQYLSLQSSETAVAIVLGVVLHDGVGRLLIMVREGKLPFIGKEGAPLENKNKD